MLLVSLVAAGFAWLLVRVRRRRTRRAGWLPFAVAGSLVIAAVPLGGIAGRADFVAALLVCDDAPQRADAVFVASGDVDFHRTRYAADVFRRTHARWFVLSGAGAGGDSGALMAEAAVSFGIPRAAIVLETRATSTRENAVFVRELLDGIDGVKTVATVTDPLHSRRFAMAARRAWPGRRVVSATVPESLDPLACRVRSWGDHPPCRRAVAEEWKKLLGYFALGWI